MKNFVCLPLLTLAGIVAYASNNALSAPQDEPQQAPARQADPWQIGQPVKASVRIRNADWTASTTTTLDQEQTRVLCELLNSSKPVSFEGDYERIHREDVIITLFYEEGGEKVFSLFFDYAGQKDILYEGEAEDISMGIMYGEEIFSGGRFVPELKKFLNHLEQPASGK